MASEEIARKLAAITGKPITEYLDVSDAETEQGQDMQDQHEISVDKVESTEGSYTKEAKASSPRIRNEEELLKYQALFDGSRIVGFTIVDGRQMTRKEFLQYSKGLNRDEIIKHPLVYKMFRSEGQTEISFLRWTDRFAEAENESEEQE